LYLPLWRPCKRKITITEKRKNNLREFCQILEATFEPAAEQLEEVLVKPKSTDITLDLFGLTWMPYRKDAGGRLSPDWQ